VNWKFVYSIVQITCNTHWDSPAVDRLWPENKKKLRKSTKEKQTGQFWNKIHGEKELKIVLCWKDGQRKWLMMWQFIKVVGFIRPLCSELVRCYRSDTVVYEGWSPSNSLCVDGIGRTLLTQTWSNTETFYCQPGQTYRMMHQTWRDLQSPKVPLQSLSHCGCFSPYVG